VAILNTLGLPLVRKVLAKSKVVVFQCVIKETYDAKASLQCFAIAKRSVVGLKRKELFQHLRLKEAQVSTYEGRNERTERLVEQLLRQHLHQTTPAETGTLHTY
jgi:hypothetical protein